MKLRISKSLFFATTLLVLYIVGTPAEAAVRHLRSEHRILLRHLQSFQAVTAQQIPINVIRQMGRKPYRLAEPGADWNETDVIRPGLASLRLVWAKRLDQYLFIHFEEGGIGYSTWVMLVELKPDGSANVLWRAYGGLYTNEAAFLRDLADDNLSDD